MKNPLHQFKILVADSDQQLSRVLQQLLAKMGFSNVEVMRSGEKVLERLKDTPVDFLVTEWKLQDVDGIDVINYVRHDATSPNPTLPIIMLTGRAEQSDVATARDHGINEYVIKPFSAKSLYDRLERIIDKPRQFVVTGSFVGPDRRHKGEPPDGVSDRRVLKPRPHARPKDASIELKSGNTPKLWLPEYALKRKLGQDVQLTSIVTPSVLTEAQAAIDAISIDSLQWIKDNLTELKFLSKSLETEAKPAGLVTELSEVALTINARAGTFGYVSAKKVAYMLHMFCRNHLDPKNAIHRTIVQKHIEVLQVILGSQTSGEENKGNNEIIAVLQNLVNKYAT